MTIIAALTIFAIALAPAASAHASKHSADGKVRVTWGFQDEPAFTGSKLRLDLILRDNATGAGIGGITPANITELSLHYGDDEYDLGNITAFRGVKGGAFAGDGNYTGQHTVRLTKPGIYVLHLKGTIAGSEIDLEIPSAHPYESPDEIAFPPVEAGSDEDLTARVAQLESDVAALRAQIKTQTETPATLVPVTTTAQHPDPIPALGLVALAAGIVAAALVLRRK